MPIITIYQGTFSGGEEIAKGIAEVLGYRRAGREELVSASLRYGIEEARLNQILDKEPHWWERWLETLRPYRVILQAAMCEVAEGGKLVYHGHIGHELLPGIRHVLKVLLTAPLEFRTKQVQTQQRLDEGAARRYIDHLDKARARRLMALFGSDWRDVTRYDLAVNLEQMGVEGATRVIAETSRLPQFEVTPASEEDFRNLALASRVQAALVISPKFQNLGLSIQAAAGEVRVSGLLPQTVSQREIVEVIQRVPGVSKVTADLIAPPAELRRGYG